MTKFDVLSFYGREDEELQKEYKRIFCNMMEKEKRLLLKDLSARLPYGVYVDAYSWQKDTPKLLIECVPEYVGEEIVVKCLAGRHSIKEIKPYLRPISSMTEEEQEAYDKWHEELEEGRIKDWKYAEYNDWLIAHHFDFRNLIGKGLALEAPEGMYKTE